MIFRNKLLNNISQIESLKAKLKAQKIHCKLEAIICTAKSKSTLKRRKLMSFDNSDNNPNSKKYHNFHDYVRQTVQKIENRPINIKIKNGSMKEVSSTQP